MTLDEIRQAFKAYGVTQTITVGAYDESGKPDTVYILDGAPDGKLLVVGGASSHDIRTARVFYRGTKSYTDTENAAVAALPQEPVTVWLSSKKYRITPKYGGFVNIGNTSGAYAVVMLYEVLKTS